MRLKKKKKSKMTYKKTTMKVIKCQKIMYNEYPAFCETRDMH